MSQYPDHHDPYARPRPALDPSLYPPTQEWNAAAHQPYPDQSYYPPTPPPIPTPPSYPPPYAYGAPPYPQPPYPAPPQGPLKRTKFGWASCVVGGIGLFLSWIPIFGYVILGAQAILVVIGLVGPHERTRIPAGIGAGLLVLGVLVNIVATVYLRDYLNGF